MSRIAVLIAVVVAALLAPSAIAVAAPNDEGSSASARKKLEQAARNYNNAKTKLDASTKRRADLGREIAADGRRIAQLRVAVGKLAGLRYKQGPTRTLLGAALTAESPDLLRQAETLRYLGIRDSRQINELASLRTKQTKERAELAKTIADQRKQVELLKKRKAEAQAAVDAVSDGASAGYDGGAVTAAPVPRNADGSLPSESCSVDDPTTDGCITPRMLHDYNEVRRAGFKRYTACYRPEEDGGEHPRGRACDFSVTVGGFEGEAYGDARTYGNNLAAWLVANAQPLAVLYVIWFRQIWLPGVGWSSYSGSGSPSAEHTNHVHLSVE